MMQPRCPRRTWLGWRLVAPLAFAVAAPVAARAQVGTMSGAIPLDAAVRQALASHPSVTAAGWGAEEAEAAVGEVTAARFPAITLSGSAVRYQAPMLVTPIHGFTPGLTPPFDRTLLQGGASLSYTLFDGGARGSRVRQARFRSAGAAAGRTAAEQALIARVVAAYANVLSQRQVLGATDGRLEALRAERRRAAQRVAAGRSAEVEILRAEAAVAEAEAARVRLSAAREVGERDLARLTGLPSERVRDAALAAVATAEPDLPPREALIAQALESSPEVAQARRQEQAAQAGVSVVRGVRWPEFRLIGAYVDRGSAEGDFEDEWSVGAQFSYPIFTGGAVSSRVRRAEAQHSGAREQSRLAELRVAEEVDRGVSRVAEARARVEALARAEASLDEVRRIELLALDAGAGTQTDYLKAEADLLAIRADLAAARYGEIVARAELARATGALGLAWLAENVESKP